ncbi:Protein of unknown function [Bacillus cereus]|nr:Protein of unknown function [Bacillus cereus]
MKLLEKLFVFVVKRVVCVIEEAKLRRVLETKFG